MKDYCDQVKYDEERADDDNDDLITSANEVMFTLRASEAAAQCIVIGHVSGCVCVFVARLPR